MRLTVGHKNRDSRHRGFVANLNFRANGEMLQAMADKRTGLDWRGTARYRVSVSQKTPFVAQLTADYFGLSHGSCGKKSTALSVRAPSR